MYGVNRATYVVGLTEYNELFTGFIPGVGFEFMFGRKKGHGFNVDVNYPIGSAAFTKQIDKMNNDRGVEDITMLPVTLSIGYHHEF